MFISGCACWELLCRTRSLSRGYCSMGSIWTCLCASFSPRASVRFSRSTWLFLRLRSSSLSSLSGQLVSDTCGCPSLLLLWLACHSDYPYSLHAATLSRCDHRLTKRLQPTERAVFALCVSYS